VHLVGEAKLPYADDKEKLGQILTAPQRGGMGSSLAMMHQCKT